MVYSPDFLGVANTVPTRCSEGQRRVRLSQQRVTVFGRLGGRSWASGTCRGNRTCLSRPGCRSSAARHVSATRAGGAVPWWCWVRLHALAVASRSHPLPDAAKGRGRERVQGQRGEADHDKGRTDQRQQEQQPQSLHRSCCLYATVQGTSAKRSADLCQRLSRVPNAGQSGERFMGVVSYWAMVSDDEVARLARLVVLLLHSQQLLKRQRAQAASNVRWSWVRLHTLAGEVAQPSTSCCGR